MQIAIGTAVWGRPKTTELFWAAVDRLREQWAAHEVVAYAAGSEDAHRELTKRAGGVWVEFDNQPLGRKWNMVSRQAYRDGADYLVILGSDDVLSPKMGERYLATMEQGVRYFGVRGCYMAEPWSRRAIHIQGHASQARLTEVVGAGRAVGRELLALADGALWPDVARRGLDWLMTSRLRTLGVPGVDLILPDDAEAFVLDIKGTQNMWPLDHVARYAPTQAVDYTQLVALLPVPERAILIKLEAARCSCCGQVRAEML